MKQPIELRKKQYSESITIHRTKQCIDITELAKHDTLNSANNKIRNTLDLYHVKPVNANIVVI